MHLGLKRASHTLTIFVGPSAIGKTRTITRLIERFPDRFQRVITTTTRAQRPDDAPDAYYFVSPEEFERWIEEDRFVEHAEYLGQRYGSLKQEIRRVLSGSHGLVALEPNGAQAYWQYRDRWPMKFILLKPASAGVLEKNLDRRQVFDQAKRARLIAEAKNFVLPPHLEHAIISVEGEDEHDEPLILAALESLCK